MEVDTLSPSDCFWGALQPLHVNRLTADRLYGATQIVDTSRVVTDKIRLKLQLKCGEAFAIGPGKAQLLEAIDREGSISGAGRALGMSYRKAWLLVDEMNRCFIERLVDTAAGGANRGAKLTAVGRAALLAFREMEADAIRAAGGGAWPRLQDLIRDAPLPTHR